jgi:hypothetical protein
MNNHTINFFAALCATAMFASAPAWAGEITGKITDAQTGNPIAGACATAFGTNDIVGSQPTGANGVYTISNLGIDDEWEVLATDCSDPVTYSAVDYKDIPGLNRNRAKFIKIKKLDEVKKKVDFELPVAGHVLVRTRNLSDDVPISGVTVCPWGSAPDKKGNVFQTDFCRVTAAGSGEALFNVVAGGNKFTVSTQFLFCWYQDQDNFDDAIIVNAPAGQTVDINFVLNGPGPC